MELVFDVETTPVPKDGRPRFPARIHYIVAKDPCSGILYEAHGGDLELLVELLAGASRLIGHNIAQFDIPLLEYYFPGAFRFSGEIFDTLCASRLAFIATMRERSAEFRHKVAGLTDAELEARMPKALLDRHSLEAWGYRLGHPKQHADMAECEFWFPSPRLLERCISDVQLNTELYEVLLNTPGHKSWRETCSVRSFLTESRCAYILGQMERNGVGFDSRAALRLVDELRRKLEARQSELRAAVPAWWELQGKPQTPKTTRVLRKGRLYPVRYEKGAEYQRCTPVFFNAASGKHRVRYLESCGWDSKTAAQTEKNNPRTDEDVLSRLDYPFVPEMLDYLLLKKRLGFLTDGKNAWLNLVTPQDTLHGRMHVTGTRTSRGAHFKPNLGQVPATGKPYGAECRELFGPTRAGWRQIGVDASGLELRCLASRMAFYDNGAFRQIVLTGDVHTEFMTGTGIFIRASQKRWTYAFLYGAGDELLGLIVLQDWRKAHEQGITSDRPPDLSDARKVGKRSRQALLKRFGALDRLIVDLRAKAGGPFVSLDGRVLLCQSEHTALNDHLQSDGAVVCKHAMARWAERLHHEFGQFGDRWAAMLWCHDEYQFEAEPEIAEPLGITVADSIREAGELLGMRCPMAGEYKIGKHWGETH